MNMICHFLPTVLTVALMLQCCPSVYRLSVYGVSVLSVGNVCIVAKRCILTKNWLKKQIGNGLWGIEWSRDR